MDKNVKTILITLLILLPVTAWAVIPETHQQTPRLFGYHEIQKNDLGLFPQWLSVLERHILESKEVDDCNASQFNTCHLKNWQYFLGTINELPRMEQIRRINRYANEKEYTLDIENYGIADYWSTPREFLVNAGDCEDYAIIKMLSMKWLGYDIERMRIVVVQDTNLRTPHAVMAIEFAQDILILDNQIEEVISHHDIYHYVPVYTVNESRWWMHIQ